MCKYLKVKVRKINIISFTTILTIFLFILFSMNNMITHEVFVLVFIPLILYILIIGVSEFKKNTSSVEGLIILLRICNIRDK